MNFTARITLLTLPLLAACSGEPAEQQEPAQPGQQVAISSPEQLMDLIESKVAMPDGAEALSTYSRRYTFKGDTEVEGVYLADKEIWPKDREWVDDPIDMLGIIDGGCAQVNVTFDIASEAVTSAFCNGEA